MIVIDTSCLIRFLTNDDKEKSEIVAKILKSKEEIIIPAVVFCELEYVLKRLYKVQRQEILRIFRFLVSRSNIKIEKEIKTAIEFFASTSISFSDCLIASEAKMAEVKLVSFDQKLLKAIKENSI